MCDKTVSKDPLMRKHCHDRYMTQEMCDKDVSEYPFMSKYCQDRYRTQEMCDKVADDFLLALKKFSQLVCYK